ncbi:MAG: RNA polymerase sigma factor RpoH [Pseudomonadota bacterium]|uniref:RNA polymerase sigma factor RpoH n=1 Tax=Thermithiobacillus tepidarius TaxID=929 RepID=UPI00040DC1F0|nr:RNA polymerase sigma factor RpoH [Thermithiobacillus tepidarius]
MNTLPITLAPSAEDMSSYLRAVNSQPILSLEEEIQLGRALRDHNDLNAAYRLIMSHLRFVVRIARGYRGYGLPEPDLIQEGNIGLMKAVRRFDPDRGVRLVSFAVHWIKAEIQEFIIRNWRIVKVATTKSQRKLFFNLRSSRQKLGWIGEQESQALAAELGVSPAEVLEMESRLSGRDLPLEQPDENGDAPGYTYVADLVDESPSPVEQLTAKDWDERQHASLAEALEHLPERDRVIIQNRWLREEPKTLQALGDELGVSAERVRQLEKQAMGKLKQYLGPLQEG